MDKNPFDGHRVYNGCPDSTMQKRLDSEAARYEELKRLIPEAHVTYFPVEEQYVAHIWGKHITGFCPSFISAIEQALATLS